MGRGRNRGRTKEKLQFNNGSIINVGQISNGQRLLHAEENVLYLKVRRATVLDEGHEGLQSSLCVALELVAEEVWHS